MAKDLTRDIIIDPRFSVPPGVVDMRQESDENGWAQYDENSVAVQGPVLENPDSVVPLPPSTFSIVSQTVRMGEDGRSVVDVVFEFPDTPGVYRIEAQYSPA